MVATTWRDIDLSGLHHYGWLADLDYPDQKSKAMTIVLVSAADKLNVDVRPLLAKRFGWKAR